MIKLKTKADIEKLRESGRILTSILSELKKRAGVGMKLEELDLLAEELLKAEGVRSAFFGYRPEGARESYPAQICTSVNEQIVHGLPTNYKLKNGDILKIDFGVDYNGYITDSAITFGVGEISDEIKKLMRVTRQALQKAIEVCRSGNRLGDIGFAVESTAKKNGFKVVKNLTGHGVGFELHEDPTIFNFGDKGTGLKLKEGMVLAIEPMLSFSSETAVQKEDGSFSTDDGSLSAHFEATVAIVRGGVEVLTPHL